MTYPTDNKARKYVQCYGFLSFSKKFGTKYGKKFANKGVSAAKIFKTAAKRFNVSKYGKTLKNEGSKIGKMVGKQISEKIFPAAVDWAGSKFADKITSLNNKPENNKKKYKENKKLLFHQKEDNKSLMI